MNKLTFDTLMLFICFFSLAISCYLIVLYLQAWLNGSYIVTAYVNAFGEYWFEVIGLLGVAYISALLGIKLWSKR